MGLFVKAAIALAATVTLATGAAAQTPSHVYDLNGTLADTLGGPSLVAQNGASVGATGVAFAGSHSGLRLNNVLSAVTSGATYSAELYFSFDQVNGFRRVLNSNNGDNGAYVYNALTNYYESGAFSGGPTITAGDKLHYVLTRNTSGTNLYLNGGLAVSRPGDLASSTLTNDLLFFIDDAAEEASGSVDFIRLYDSALSANQVARLYNDGTPLQSSVLLGVGAVPEPASWAMMILGFGAIGTLARRQRRRSDQRFDQRIARIAAGEIA